MTTSQKKSGFVVLAGRSNVGKSTLLNALVGSKVAIVTPKPQTTRHPMRGVLHDDRGQIVFVDTPGVFLGKGDPVSQRLNQIVREQLEGIDAVVYVTDPTREPGEEEAMIQKILRAAPLPILLVVNKSDIEEMDRPFTETMKQIDVGQKQTLEVSATKHQNLNKLVDALFELMPVGEAFYPDLQLTDLSHKDWLEEVIREKVFLRLEQELPYTIKVEVTDIQPRGEAKTYISATVWTTEERYKKMVIGRGAEMIRQISMDARKEIEAATDKSAFLELTVEVDPKWPQRFV